MTWINYTHFRDLVLFSEENFRASFLFSCSKGLEIWKAIVIVLVFNRRTSFEFPG